MRILQDAIERLLGGRGSVPLDSATESVVPTAKPLPLQDFQKEALFVWYDYFSCPQLEGKNSFVLAGRNSFGEDGGSEQASAISSIPAYIARCRFFIALCPTLECPEEAKVLSMTTWGPLGGGGAAAAWCGGAGINLV